MFAIALHRYRLATLLAIAVVASSVGCDGRPRRVPVAGQVTIDGAPVPAGSISFVPEGGRASSGNLDAEGRFRLTCYEKEDGALLGDHRILVAARAIDSSGKLVWHAPPKYADFRTSGLTHTVEGPDDDVVIELTWAGAKKPKAVAVE